MRCPFTRFERRMCSSTGRPATSMTRIAPRYESPRTATLVPIRASFAWERVFSYRCCLRAKAADDDRRVVPAEPERVRDGDVEVGQVARDVRDVVEVAA